MSVECKPSIQNNGEATLESYRCNSCSIDFNLVEHLIEHTQEVHTQDVHSDPGRGVTCGKCQLGFADISEFIDHHRNVHLEDNCVNGNVHVENVCADDDDVLNVHIEDVHVDLGEDDVKCATVSLDSTSAVISDGESVPMDDADIPEQITIVNDNGDTIGVAEGDEVEANITNDLHGNSIPAPPTHISTYTSYQSQNINGNANRKRRLPAKFRDLLNQPESWKRVAESPSSPESKKNEVEIDVSGITNIRLKTKNDSSREGEIIHYLMRVEEKLDCIIKHFNVPLNSEPPQRSNVLANIMGKPGAFKKTVPYRNTVAESALSPLHVNIPRRQSTHASPSNPASNRPAQEVSYIQCDQSQTLPEVTQYVISDELLESTYMKSRNRGNFAKNLVYAAFPLEERLGRNCYGRRGGSLSGPKDPLEQAKLEAVCEAVFKKFPVLDGDDPEVVWKRECVIAIDTALRSEMRTRILNMQNSIKGEMMRTTNIKSEMKNIGMNVTM